MYRAFRPYLGLALIVEFLYATALGVYGADEAKPDLMHLGSCDPRAASCAIDPLFAVMM